MPEPDPHNPLETEIGKALEGLVERDPADALLQARDFLARARVDKDLAAELAARYYVSVALLRLGRFAESRGQLNALLACDAIEPVHWYARAHHIRAKVADQLADYDTALEELQAARSLFEVLRDDKGIGDCLLSIGVNFARGEDHAESLAFYRRAYQMFQRVENDAAIAAALNNIGIACKHCDLEEESEQALLEAAEIFERLEHFARRGHCWANLASLRAKQERLKEADELYRRAIADLTGEDTEHYRAEVLREHGELMLRMQQPELAIGTLASALDVAERYNEPRVEYRSHHALARANAALQRFEDAYQHERKANTLEVKALRSQIEAKVLDLQAMQRTARLRAEKEALAEEYRDLAQRAAQLDREARRDGLTDSYNRRHLEQALGNAEANQQLFTLAVVDIDDFKQVNDRFSHTTGDQVLICVAELLRQHTRDQDIVARYGGDEFVVLFHDARGALAETICARFWQAIVDYPWSELSPDLQVTVSAGIAERRDDESPAQTLARADAGLYAAKRQGKNAIQRAGAQSS